METSKQQPAPARAESALQSDAPAPNWSASDTAAQAKRTYRSEVFAQDTAPARAGRVIPKGMVLVPMHMTHQMRRVFHQDEGCTWADLLEAADAVTEEEYFEIERLDVEPQSCDALQTAPMQGIRVKFDDGFLIEWDDTIPDGEYRLVPATPPAPQAAPVQAQGQLDPRVSLDHARAMLSYVQNASAGQKFDPIFDETERRNWAMTLDYLMETAAMLLNVADRLATHPAQPAEQAGGT